MPKFVSAHRLFFIFSGGAVFLLFIFFSYIVHKDLFTAFDFDTTVHIQDHLSLWYITPFSLLSDIGKVEIVTVFLLIILAIYRKLKTFLVFIFFGLFHLFEIFGKTFVHHAPPPHFLLRTQHVLNFPQFYVSTQNSYPSGHAARAFFVTTLLAVMTMNTKKLSRLQKSILIILFVLYDVVMGISRIYLGEHWTSDVIGGSLLGMAFGFFGALFL